MCGARAQRVKRAAIEPGGDREAAHARALGGLPVVVKPVEIHSTVTGAADVKAAIEVQPSEYLIGRFRYLETGLMELRSVATNIGASMTGSNEPNPRSPTPQMDYTTVAPGL